MMCDIKMSDGMRPAKWRKVREQCADVAREYEMEMKRVMMRAEATTSRGKEWFADVERLAMSCGYVLRKTKTRSMRRRMVIAVLH